MTADPITAEARERLFKLRCRSKRGEYLSPEDMAFLENCYKRWPKVYRDISDAVHRETAPFGSQI